jgi:hypothetical protein
MAPTPRIDFELDAATVLRLIWQLDPDLTLNGFSRLKGGSTEVYKIDLANSGYGSLVLKIYPDEPEWAPMKEALVAGRLGQKVYPDPAWRRARLDKCELSADIRQEIEDNTFTYEALS